MKRNLAIALAMVLALAPAVFSHAEGDGQKAEVTEKQVVSAPAEGKTQQGGGKAEPVVKRPLHKRVVDPGEGC